MNTVPDQLGGSGQTVARGRWAAIDTPVAPQQAPNVPLMGRPLRQPQRSQQPASAIRSAALKEHSKTVEIDASVLIKIMKHCRDYFPTAVNGLLVGLECESSVEVTDCFGLQNKRELTQQLLREKIDAKDVDVKVQLEDQRYQMKMLEQLQMVNADCGNVGWYETLQFHQLKDPVIVEALCEHQAKSPDSLAIVFDPQLADLGAAAFKAFRVTDAVLKAKREADQGDTGAYSRVTGNDILIEVPLMVRNSLLIQAFLVDWLCRDPELQKAGEFSPLEYSDRGGLVEKSLGFVIGCLDDLQLEQEKLMKAQKDSMRFVQKHREEVERRRLENEQRRLRNEELLPEVLPPMKRLDMPNQIPTLLMSNRVARVSRDISSIVSDNLCRAFFLNKDTASI